MWLWAAGIILISARRFDEALVEFPKALDLDADFRTARVFLIKTYEWKGMYEEMFEEAERGAALRKYPEKRAERERMIVALRDAFRAGDYRAFRRKLLEFQLEERKTGNSRATEIAESYALLGDKDQAFAWLQKAHEVTPGVPA